jgi:hypothetical protein
MSSWQPPGGSSPSPYQPPPASSFYGPPPPKKPSSPGWWIALAACGAIVVLVCGGSCAGLFIFGKGVAEEEIAAQLRDNPKFREHIGELQSVKIDLVASGAEDKSDVFVYRVEGTKGKGRVTIRESTDDDWNTIVEEATLRLSDGTEVQIAP